MLASDRYPDLKIHIDLYRTLGVDGMTSEEEEHDASGKVSYVGFRKAYLSTSVSWLNAHLDELHHRHFAPRPYLRRAYTPKAYPPAHWIPRLPRNVYDTELLQGLKGYERARLQVRMLDHPFLYDRLA